MRHTPLGPRRAPRFGFLLAAALIAVGTPLRAQSPAAPSPVAGAVRDSATGQPLAGAVVLLRDSLERTVGRGVTNARGQFYLPAHAGARQLRVLRMGFHPADLPLGATGSGPLALALAPVPPLLAPVRVTAATRCPRRTNTPAALGLLEQVRAGLLATVIASADHPATMTALSFHRHFEPGHSPPDFADPGSETEGGARVTAQTVRTEQGAVTAAAFGASRTGAAFVAEGFRRDSAERTWFSAPDAGTLVDDDFVAGYCFRVVDAGRDRPQQLGLGFAAPRRSEGRVDVDGVLWVDTAARTLRDLTFRYVGLEAAVEALRPGGRLTFRQMPTGVALVDRWALRLVSGQVPNPAASGGVPQAYGGSGGSVIARGLVVQEAGGELARVTWPDGRAWQGPLGRLRVRLTDPRGRPAAGAIVRLTGTDYVAAADAAGVAELADVLPGRYTATATDPRLAAAGRERAAAARVVARRGETAEVRLTVEVAEPAVAAGRAAADTAPRPDGRRTVLDTSSVAIGSGKTVERLFTGRFAGVNVTPTDGGGLQIRIRGGANSFMAGEEPLFIIDGTPLQPGTGGIVFLNPYDIENIEVLKNPADVAVYGVRGANGVIRITTMRPGRRR